MTPSQRNTIFLEQAEILNHETLPAGQYALRLKAPECAAMALPGSFVHLQCDPSLAMRRPLSIMRASANEGWIDILYKVVGTGTRMLAKRLPGDSLSCLGPIGQPFVVPAVQSRPLLIGGGVGMPPMIFLAESFRRQVDCHPLVLLGSEVPFPFKPRPSQLIVQGIPAGVIASMPLLDDWHIANRLASLQGFPGCFQGYITELARHWLESLDESARSEVGIFACGPHPMLEAVAELAAEFTLPCQVSMEEFMACGVGGCAGCVIPVETAEGTSMKRVCVDGPVFDADKVFPR